MIPITESFLCSVCHLWHTQHCYWCWVCTASFELWDTIRQGVIIVHCCSVGPQHKMAAPRAWAPENWWCKWVLVKKGTPSWQAKNLQTITGELSGNHVCMRWCHCMTQYLCLRGFGMSVSLQASLIFQVITSVRKANDYRPWSNNTAH